MPMRFQGKGATRDPSPGSPPRPAPGADALAPGGSAGLTGARLRRLLCAYRPHLPLLLADLGCAVVVSATALLLPLCANLVTRRLAADAPDGLGPDRIGPILALGGAMLALLAVQALCAFVVDVQGHMMGTRMEAALRRELFEHCQRLHWGFHDRARVGQLMSRITNDSFHLGELYHHGPEDLLIAVLKTAGALALLAWLDGPLALLVFAALPLALLHALHFSGRMNRALTAVSQRIGAINERVEDALAGVRVVQSFGAEALQGRRFEAENARFVESRREGFRAGGLFSVGAEAFPQILAVLVVTGGALRVAGGAMEVADLLAFLLCVAVLGDPVRRAANLLRLWQEGIPGFGRMMEVLEIEPEVRDRPGARSLGRPRGAIAIEGVSFSYPGGPPVLRDLFLAVRPGEFVALVGPSGAGKSTLCALIPRFYDVTGGRVLVDGLDVRELSLASLRGAVGAVQQDLYLFAGTVAENIRYGRPDATSAEVVAAARAADAHGFVSALPGGYDAVVGQRGLRLSGGERQRLTIARAFLKDPAILLLDEATSALDADSERAVQGALARLARGRTTLAVTHRLSTVRDADRIVVLARGGIAEEGTHDDLLARGGLYAGLCARQSGP